MKNIVKYLQKEHPIHLVNRAIVVGAYMVAIGVPLIILLYHLFIN